MSSVPSMDRMLTFSEALRFVQHVEAIFRTMDLESIAGLFTHRAVVRFPFAEPVVGRESIAEFLRIRYSDISEYRLTKELVAVHGDRIAVKLQAQWRSASTGALFASVAMEVLTVEDSRIAEWEAVSVCQSRADPTPA